MTEGPFTCMSGCRSDQAFGSELDVVLRPLIAARAREVARALMESLDFEAIAEGVLNRGEYSGGRLGTAIAHAINQHLAEEALPNGQLPEGCEY